MTIHRIRLRTAATWLVTATTLLALPAAAHAADLRVAYAGSMGAVMDLYLGPAFAKKHKVEYQGEGDGAYGLAHLIAARKIQPDVFVSITPGPIEILIKAGLVKKAYPVASTAMCIAYSPNSPYAKDFRKAAAGRIPWYTVLEMPGVRFGRTDPETDPQGQNIIFAFMLAEKYYHQPDLVKTILGPLENQTQIFTEVSLLARLKSGQMAASSGYLSAARSLHLPYITLPDQINLSNPSMSRGWYSKVHFTLNVNGKPKTVGTQPLVFYAAVPASAPDPELGMAFIHFMNSPAGQAMFQKTGYSQPEGPDLK